MANEQHIEMSAIKEASEIGEHDIVGNYAKRYTKRYKDLIKELKNELENDDHITDIQVKIEILVTTISSCFNNELVRSVLGCINEKYVDKFIDQILSESNFMIRHIYNHYKKL